MWSLRPCAAAGVRRRHPGTAGPCDHRGSCRPAPRGHADPGGQPDGRSRDPRRERSHADYQPPKLELTGRGAVRRPKEVAMRSNRTRGGWDRQPPVADAALRQSVLRVRARPSNLWLRVGAAACGAAAHARRASRRARSERAGVGVSEFVPPAASLAPRTRLGRHFDRPRHRHRGSARVARRSDRTNRRCPLRTPTHPPARGRRVPSILDAFPPGTPLTLEALEDLMAADFERRTLAALAHALDRLAAPALPPPPSPETPDLPN